MAKYSVVLLSVPLCSLMRSDVLSLCTGITKKNMEFDWLIVQQRRPDIKYPSLS